MLCMGLTAPTLHTQLLWWPTLSSSQNASYSQIPFNPTLLHMRCSNPPAGAGDAPLRCASVKRSRACG